MELDIDQNLLKITSTVIEVNNNNYNNKNNNGTNLIFILCNRYLYTYSYNLLVPIKIKFYTCKITYLYTLSISKKRVINAGGIRI
jgi:hypothetical protein